MLVSLNHAYEHKIENSYLLLLHFSCIYLISYAYCPSNMFIFLFYFLKFNSYNEGFDFKMFLLKTPRNANQLSYMTFGTIKYVEFLCAIIYIYIYISHFLNKITIF